jgi:sugar/nucleoside kinase (ribokinase family)
MSHGVTDVLGIGNAMVDVVSDVNEGFLKKHGLTKGAMTLIDAERAEGLYSALGACVEVSGGSVANTMAALAAAGARSAYIGKVKDDRLGRVFRREMQRAGVAFDVPAAVSGPATGRCLVFVTPDGQRTMQTFLGAAATLAPEDVDAETVRGARFVYLEGYLFDPPPAKAAFYRAAEIAHRAGRKVAMSLSDSFCVDRHRADFSDFVGRHVDILFANEDEVISLAEAAGLEEAVGRLRGQCEICAVTLGDRGSLILAGDRCIEVGAEPVERVVDTTGAGDLYAGGFLYGLARGKEPAACGCLGSRLAAEVIGQFGARLSTIPEMD